MRHIAKSSVPAVNSPQLWVHSESNTLLSWGGEGPEGDVAGAKAKKLWALNPDANGEGAWKEQDPANPSDFASIRRVVYGSSTTCANVALHQGGFGTHTTDSYFQGTNRYPVSGLALFDMVSKTWSNRTDPIPPQVGQFWGSAVCMPPGVASKHLAFFMGGQRQLDTANFASFSNVTFYDPQADKWLWQMASGSIPPPRSMFCSVGVASRNGTYEM